MNVEEKTKMAGLSKIDPKHQIVVTHVTIRQSIFFLILRLIILEILAGVLVIVLHTILFSTDIVETIFGNAQVFNTPLFILLILIKTIVMIVVVMMWLEEYYEITPREIIHKNGFIFRFEEQNKLIHIGSVTLEQGLFGRIFNYGTIKFYNWTQDKTSYLYLIHNPLKYYHILQSLLPEADEDKRVVREHLIEEEQI